jgi:hypothetical protein
MESDQKINEEEKRVIQKVNVIYVIFFGLFVVSLFFPYIYQTHPNAYILGIIFIFFLPFAALIFGGMGLILASIFYSFSFKLRNAEKSGWIGGGLLGGMFFIWIYWIFFRPPQVGFFLGLGAFVGIIFILITLHKKRTLEPILRRQVEEKKKKKMEVQQAQAITYLFCPQCGQIVSESWEKCIKCALDLTKNPPLNTLPRFLTHKFCTKCQQEVVPKKEFQTCIFIFTLCIGFCTFIWLIYLLYYALAQKPVCPICHKKTFLIPLQKPSLISSQQPSSIPSIPETILETTAAVSPLFCPNCGTAIKNKEEAFCGVCGTKLKA